MTPFSIFKAKQVCFSIPGTNLMLHKHQLVDATVTLPSECCRGCRCLCQMALMVEIGSYSNTAAHHLCLAILYLVKVKSFQLNFKK